MDAAATPPEPDATHRLQADAFWRRWRARRTPPSPAPPDVPRVALLPPRLWHHYRHFSWVAAEQRLMLLILAALLGACGLVWSAALRLRDKPPVVLRAAASLQEEARDFSRVPQVSYDQLVFFLNGCLPLLYASGRGGHPLLPLAQGLVAPAIYDEAERRLDAAERGGKGRGLIQGLTLAGVTDVVADDASGRAAAYVRGDLAVTLGGAATEFFPWRAHALLAANPASRLNPYPFYLLRLETRTGPAAAAWDRAEAATRP